MRSTVLITGGLGYVGGRLTQRLARDVNVIVATREQPSATLLELHGNPLVVPYGELSDGGRLLAGIDAVVHLAALNELECMRSPSEAIRVNIDGTRRVLEWSIAAGVSHFIYFSTAHVYGALEGSIAEETLPVPIHPYAITHRAAEDYVVMAGLQQRIGVTVFRLSNSFGAPVSPSVNRWTLVVNELCRQVVEQGELILKSNGEQFRDFVCLTDVAEVVASFVANGGARRHTVYNLGSGSSMRVVDMAHLIGRNAAQRLGRPVSIRLPQDTVPIAAPVFKFDVGRIRAEGVKIANDVDAELSNLIDFCARHFRRGT